MFRVTPDAREFLLREGTDLKYGARHLKRAIERHVVYPLAKLLATDQVGLGDVITIDWSHCDGGLEFSKEVETAPMPFGPPEYEALHASRIPSRSVQEPESGCGIELSWGVVFPARVDFGLHQESSDRA